MILNINIDDESYELEVQETLIKELKPAFDDLDSEFDRGVQMGRFWVEKPDAEQRCQVTMNKLVSAIHQEDKRNVYIMAAFIVYKFPDVLSVTFSSEYEMQDIDIHLKSDA